MKKQAGFSLIELVVAMAVLALIMGAMVHLFGGSVTSLHTGARQEVVYEEARLLMNELKTTLRYADKDVLIRSSRRSARINFPIKVIFGTGIWILLKEPIRNIK